MKSFNEWKKDRDDWQKIWTQDSFGNQIDEPTPEQMNQWSREKKKRQIEKENRRHRRRVAKNFFRTR